MKLCLASGNAHKAQEFQQLADAGPLRGALQIVSAREACGGMPSVVEDTGTFVGNARKKARALYEKLRNTPHPSGVTEQRAGASVVAQAASLQSGSGVPPLFFESGKMPLPLRAAQTASLSERATWATTPWACVAQAASLPDHSNAVDVKAGWQPALRRSAKSECPNRPQQSQRDARVPAPGWWVMSDDSGLCVDALGGDPGVESAYYAGPQGDGAANLAKLVRVMRDVPDANRARTAHFVCVLVVISPEGEEHVFEGRCDGHLARAPRGGGGFGYDPLFVPDGFEKTFSELGESEKNALSHRACAWKQAEAFFKLISEA